MKNIRTLTKRRAVSPVIATVVLVAVTITVAVAVSYWMSGITGQYTSFEKIEIQSAVFTPNTLPGYWEIEITLKNTGTKTATLTNVFVNEVLSVYTADYTALGLGSADAILFGSSLDPDNPMSIESGAPGTVIVWIEEGTYATLTSGTTVNIKIHSASGMDYIKLVQLH